MKFVSNNVLLKLEKKALAKNKDLEFVEEALCSGLFFEGYKNTKGQREGPGILVWADKTCYEGGFKEGLRNGHGVMKFSNGDRLYGHFKSDKAQGYGEIKYANNSAY